MSRFPLKLSCPIVRHCRKIIIIKKKCRTVWRSRTSVYDLVGKLSWLALVERANCLHPCQVMSLWLSVYGHRLFSYLSLACELVQSGNLTGSSVLGEYWTRDCPQLWQLSVRSVGCCHTALPRARSSRLMEEQMLSANSMRTSTDGIFFVHPFHL